MDAVIRLLNQKVPKLIETKIPKLRKEIINVFADAGVNAAGKKIKEKILTIIGSGITLNRHWHKRYYESL